MDELMRRSVGGRLTPTDAAETRRVAHALSGRPDGLDLLREVVIEEGMLRVVLGRIHAEPGQGRAVARARADRHGRASFGDYWPHRHATPAWRRRVVQAAAILLVVGGVAAGVGSRGALPWMQRGTPSEPRAVTTGPGQRATVDLPDGSRAILAPSTTLRYAIAADAGPRELQLDGEAYFDVRHDAARPFRVRTRSAVIEDVGTAFVVRAYATDAHARVVVRAGAVTLRPRAARDSSGLTLRQGEAAAVDSSGTAVRLMGNPASDWAWITGRLVFDETPLPAVLAELHRWYDVDFRLDDSVLADQYFTGAFEAAPLSHVLDILGPVVHARFERQGSVIVVTPRPGSP